MSIGLRGRNDCPLKIQVDQGKRAFYFGDTRNPYPLDTMKAREWQRGFNIAYYDNLNKIR